MQPPRDPGPSAAVWQLNPLIDLHWRVWDQNCVAFEAVSGDTSVLDPLEAALLACLEDQPASLDELTTVLASDLGTEADQAMRQRVEAIVEHFLARGWIQSLDSTG